LELEMRTRQRGDSLAFPGLILALTCLALSAPALAYVDLAPTLAKIISDSRQIARVEVERYDAQDHTILLKSAEALKGEAIAGPIRHQVSASTGAAVPRQILQWASPGARGVLFASRATSLVCMGESWYLVRASGSGEAKTWRLGQERPDLPLAYCGTVSRLAEAVRQMLAGKEAVITMVPHGAEGEAASFDLALNRFNIPGLVKVQRMRVNLKMTGPVMATSANPTYVLGQGPVDEADLPMLVEKLSSSDATVRAEAAEDLRSLGRKAEAALPALKKILGDNTPRVRLSAASALLRISSGGHAAHHAATPNAQTPPDASAAIDVLSQGLAGADPTVRRDAAKATGFAGPAAGGALTDKLSSLLKDPDPTVRIAALQAIAVLGPAAPKAAPAVKALLDDPDLAIDATDALGRIGPAAQPVPPQIVKMLSSPQGSVQWTAVRAMAQIGGPGAHPAVEYMIKALPHATEVDGYNTMIYLSLLGTEAKDAEQTIRTTRIKNPVLPSATLWALSPETRFPWQGGQGDGPFGGPGGGGPPGGFGGGGRGPGGGVDIFAAIYEAYVDELGQRLRPAAPVLAREIIDGTAGNVPDWGYRILTCGPDEALAVLTPHLSDGQLTTRERAELALGFMGPAAEPAKSKLTEAMNKTSNERERRLIQWSLRKIAEE
jgi:HEAT repeat protein